MWLEQTTRKVGPKEADAIYRRLVDCDAKRDQEIYKQKAARIAEESATCLFTPGILNKTKRDPDALELHKRVDRILKERQDNVAKLKMDEAHQREEDLRASCTFKPKINRDNTPGRSKQMVADIEGWKKKIQDRLFEEYFDINKKEEATFKPSILRKSQDIVRAKTPDGRKVKVEDRLFGLSRQKKVLNENSESQKSLALSKSKSNNNLTKSQTFATLKNLEGRNSTSHKQLTVEQPAKTLRRNSRSRLTIITVDELCSHHASTMSHVCNDKPKDD